MKTIRVTRIALSIAALLVVAMVRPASAQYSKAQLKGTYAFRLEPATSFAEKLVAVTNTAGVATFADPAGVLAAATAPNKVNVMQVGEFTANGAGAITAGETYATVDDENGSTALVDFTWSGSYTVSSDGTGTLTMTPGAANTSNWKCYDMTSPADLLDWQVAPVAVTTNGITVYPITNGGAWASNTAYPIDYQILPTGSTNPGGYVFLATVAGTSSAGAPSFWNQNVGAAVADGTAGLTWTNIGVGAPQILPISTGADAGNFVFEPTSLSAWAAATRYIQGVSLILPTSPTSLNPGGYVYGVSAIGSLPDWKAGQAYGAFPDWAKSTAYAVGAEIFPSVGNASFDVWEATVAGTSSAGEPTWTGTTVADGTNGLTWTNQGAVSATTISEIQPTVGNPGQNVLCTASGTPLACCTGSGTGTCPGYVYEATTPGVSSATTEPVWPQNMGATVTDNTVVWTNKGLGQFISGGLTAWSGGTQPIWNQTLAGKTSDGAITWTNLGVMGKTGTSEPGTWGQAVGAITTDGAIAWQNMGPAPATPIACNPSWEGTAVYATSLSVTYGRLEMTETDNYPIAGNTVCEGAASNPSVAAYPYSCCTGTGAGPTCTNVVNAACTAANTPSACCTGSSTGHCLAKIFMTGEAVKRP